MRPKAIAIADDGVASVGRTVGDALSAERFITSTTFFEARLRTRHHSAFRILAWRDAILTDFTRTCVIFDCFF